MTGNATEDDPSVIESSISDSPSSLKARAAAKQTTIIRETTIHGKQARAAAIEVVTR